MWRQCNKTKMYKSELETVFATVSRKCSSSVSERDHSQFFIRTRNYLWIFEKIKTEIQRLSNMPTTHHCPKQRQGNCRNAKGLDGKAICSKHQTNCRNVGPNGKTCLKKRLKDEVCSKCRVWQYVQPTFLSEDIEIWTLWLDSDTISYKSKILFG